MGGNKTPLAKNYQRELLRLAMQLDEQEDSLFKALSGVAMYRNFKCTFVDRIHGNYFLAIDDKAGDLAGIIWVRVNKNEFREPSLIIGDIIVAPSFRGKGVATALIESAKKYAKNTGCTSVTLNVISNNHAAKNLYNKIGFSTVSENMLLKL